MNDMLLGLGKRRVGALADVVSATRFLTDVNEQDDLNAVWGARLGAHRPTTTTVEVSRLATHASCKIEISVIAVRPERAPAPRPTAARRSKRPRKAARR